MTTLRTLAHVANLLIKEQAVRLEKSWGMLPYSVYWRGFHDGRTAAANAILEVAADDTAHSRYPEGRRFYDDAAEIARGY